MSLLRAILLGLLLWLITIDLSGWVKKGARRIVQRAAHNLPSAKRGLYLKKWQDELEQRDDRPLSMLVIAAWIAAGARGLVKELAEPAAPEAAARGALQRFCELVERESASLVITTMIFAAAPSAAGPLTLGDSQTHRWVALVMATLFSIVVFIAIRYRRARRGWG